MLKNDHKKIDILIVEDNPGDTRLIMEALNERDIVTSHMVKDGVQAMDFLHKDSGYSQVPRPDLILLDLNLPKKDGREVLSEIKADEKLKKIPVVILTTSQAEEDILKSYNLHANCYITKPLDYNQFVTVVRSIEDFWFSIVKLPVD